ncbi:MAG: Transcriptional regulator, MarR family [uncultured Pseudonocardia sp.]|uniref:Transcriptional regulator, MarR family n=1 Tax=uncultured Pseudonocardia sp. TaxID=211455 RepID=A0A6J4QD40_9PSEU|nr:MAG: Transcriptional regulator, MarR family [uncultured Pseudonocardia sp.]
MTRWLSDDEQATWRSFLVASRLLWDQVERQLQNDSGLPHAYYEILVQLSEAPERRLRMNQLASTSLSSRSRISHAVARLEEAGWVVRVACGTDGRGLDAVLTDAGLEQLRSTAPGHVEQVRELLIDPLSPEQLAALRDISETLVEHLRRTSPFPV